MVRLRRYNLDVTHAATDPRCEPMILQELRGEIEADLTRRIDALKEPQPLREALRYALLAGSGKRLRPALTLLCCEAAGGRRDDTCPARSPSPPDRSAPSCMSPIITPSRSAAPIQSPYAFPSTRAEPLTEI